MIWDPRNLYIQNETWYNDGPSLPIEFARISDDNRLTLVIKPGWQEVTTFYALSGFEDLDLGIENLSAREKTNNRNIGYYNFISQEFRIGRAVEQTRQRLLEWEKTHKIDAVIWTDLPPNFVNKKNQPFTLKNIQDHLNGLSRVESSLAKHYIFNTPKQISTRFRMGLEVSLLDIEKKLSSKE